MVRYEQPNLSVVFCGNNDTPIRRTGHKSSPLTGELDWVGTTRFAERERRLRKESGSSVDAAACARGTYFSTVTSVPIGVYGHTFAAAASGSSTHPRLCGVPNEERLNAWIPSPALK